MDASDYLDWFRLSGLYLRDLSHVDRYQSCRPLLSPAGLTTLIAAEFLEETDPVVDVGAWRTFQVYEAGDDQQRRIALTADALESLGALRIAAAVRAAQSDSPFDTITELFSQGNLHGFADVQQAMPGTTVLDLLNHMRENLARNMPELAEQAGLRLPPRSPAAVNPDYESREQIEHLLNQFVQAHQPELQSDLDRHGDPRRAAGYTREGRLQEIEQLRQRMYAAEAQQNDAGKLQSLIDDICTLVKTPAEGNKKAQIRLDQSCLRFRRLLKECRALPAGEVIPELAAALKSAEVLLAARPELFAPKKVGDDALTARLNAIGDYESKQARNRVEVRWDSPQGFDCNWCSLELTLCCSKSNPGRLQRLVDAAERIRARMPQLVEDWRNRLIANFRDNYQVQLADWEIEDYETNDDGDVTDESILSHAGGGHILLEMDPDDDAIHVTTHFNVDWDEEHGFAIEGEFEPGETQAGPGVDIESLGLAETGPQLAGADIARFEARFGIELPEDYRQFLLAANGGRPRRRRLRTRHEGETYEAEILRLLPLMGSSAEPDPEGSLEAALQRARTDHWPIELLPIAEVRQSGLMPLEDQSPSFLVLVLSGAKAGRVLLANPGALLQGLTGVPPSAAESIRAQMIGQLIEYSATAGRSLAELFGGLKEPAPDRSPAWLKAIRNDSIPQFLQWVESGGKPGETYKERGLPIALSVADYLACHGSAGLLDAVVRQKFVTAKQLCESWERICLRSLSRFRVLMPLLPTAMWKSVLASHEVWNHPDLWEELAAAGVDFNDAVDEEGQTPIHLAVQAGSPAAVKWLMQHGADPRAFDKYQRNAFTWTDRGPGYDCLAVLEGKDDQAPPRPARSDVEGIEQLGAAAKELTEGVSLVIAIQIKSPPVTQIEQALYSECHYRLSIDVQRRCITFNDMNSPRQDYLHADGWPAILFVPIVQWPQLTPLWETLEVQEFDWNKAQKQRKYRPAPRPDLQPPARGALEQAFNAEEAAARKTRMRK